LLRRVVGIAALTMLLPLLAVPTSRDAMAGNGTALEEAQATPTQHLVALPMVARNGLPGDIISNNPPPYPPGTRTGVAAVDEVLAALAADSPGPLKTLLQSTPAPCVVNPQGITNPPLCPEGVPAGTLVPVFRASACESVWPDYFDQLLRDSLWRGPRPVLAIYRDPTDAYGWLPPADYAVVVLQAGPPAGGRPAVIRVSNGRVNGILFGCGHTFDQLVAGVDAARFVLPPQR
jgi:hypothetical protein